MKHNTGKEEEINQTVLVGDRQGSDGGTIVRDLDLHGAIVELEDLWSVLALIRH